MKSLLSGSKIAQSDRRVKHNGPPSRRGALRPDGDPDTEEQVVLPLALGDDAADRQLGLVERAVQVAYLRRHLDRSASHAAKTETDVTGWPPLIPGSGEVERIPLEPAAEPEGRLEARSTLAVGRNGQQHSRGAAHQGHLVGWADHRRRVRGPRVVRAEAIEAVGVARPAPAGRVLPVE